MAALAAQKVAARRGLSAFRLFHRFVTVIIIAVQVQVKKLLQVDVRLVQTRLLLEDGVDDGTIEVDEDAHEKLGLLLQVAMLITPLSARSRPARCSLRSSGHTITVRWNT